ncbi:hypothetical protein G6N74_19180 [Mesorhizobium sp. CGMCC 1.15528]|uniref:Uncharacterized protein n=1 Tax=Mesorhizobium zhangyense TaxID=1776730 RepID=A0A7C9R9X6_9HYPH|nr:hypothetical protein [Mesorhizobium zhangyense]NGN43198.1 hypothetical protein [Mesorhizobium zhangyense]
MLEQLGSFATAFLLYLMLGFPFLIWSGRTVYASVQVEVDGKLRGKPSTGATIFLAVIPILFIAYYFLSGIGGMQHQQRVSDWGPYMFLSLPPACGLLAGYVIGVILGRNSG